MSTADIKEDAYRLDEVADTGGFLDIVCHEQDR